ncbi:MAG: hypothetical protein KC431_00535 [Myxococcales bacterium]|nr:hypothetical protein [Myxococcales bacterium]
MSSATIPTVDRRLGWAALALAVLCLGRWGLLAAGVELSFEPADPEPEPWYDQPRELPPPPPYLPAARELLGGLDHGDAFEKGWAVDHVEGPNDDGEIRVVGMRDGQTISVWLRPRGGDDRPPPIRTRHWDIFYDRPDPLIPKLGPGEFPAIMNGIADRVRANEGPGEEQPPG